MRHTVEGKLFLDGWGRLYFDTCPDSATHILRPIPEGEERARHCRVYMEDILRDTINQTGIFSVEVTRIEGDEKIEVRIPVSEAELLEELNQASIFLGSRQENLEDFDKERMNTAQVLALGALFFKHLHEMPEPFRGTYSSLVQQIALSLKEA